MTKTEAKKQATKRMKYGYYRPNICSSEVYVTCPICAYKVITYSVPKLKTELVEHLHLDH